MCISRLQNSHFYLRDARKIEKPFNNSTITYFCHENRIGDSMVSRYYIIDLDEGQKINDIYSFVGNMSKFNLLQNAVLADDYYSCSDDLRFNLYFVILTNKLISIEILREIQCDYNFGRKLIFDEKLADIYFNSFNCVSRSRNSKDKLHRSNNSEFVKKLADVDRTIIEKISKLSLDSYEQNRMFVDLLPSFENRNPISRFTDLLFKSKQNRDYQERHSYFKSWIDIEYGLFLHESDHFKNEQSLLSIKGKKNRHGRKIVQPISDSSILNHIERMTIEGYKNFSSPQSLHFSRVNLLYGENGSGKTSIINSIKSALTGTSPDTTADKNCKINVFGKSKEGEIMHFCNANNNFDDYAQLWYNVTKNELAKYFDKYNYFDGGRALDFALNDLEIADLFIDASVNRTIKNLYENKKFLAEQVKYAFDAIDYENIKAYLPSPDEARRNLENAGVLIKEFRNGNFRIELTKPFEKYTRKLQQSINSVRYQSLYNLKESMKKELEASEEQDISNSIMEKLGIYDRIRTLFLLLTSARDYSDLQSNQKSSLSAIKIYSNVEVLPSNMSAGQRVCFALATLLASFLENSKAPNILILDEPLANLDDLHLLNMLDIIRQLAINDTQIFFTTANESVAKLFVRKFGFMQNELRSIKVSDIGDKVIISDF